MRRGLVTRRADHDQRFAEEADGLDDLVADVGMTARPTRSRKPMKPGDRRFRFGAGRRRLCARPASKRMRVGVLAANGDAGFLAGGAFAEGAVDQIGAGDIDAAEIGDIDDRAWL